MTRYNPDAMLDNLIAKEDAERVYNERLAELRERMIKLQQENEKLNHYKLLYQKVKDRNDKAIKMIEQDELHLYSTDSNEVFEAGVEELLEILKGNNETD